MHEAKRRLVRPPPRLERLYDAVDSYAAVDATAREGCVEGGECEYSEDDDNK